MPGNASADKRVNRPSTMSRGNRCAAPAAAGAAISGRCGTSRWKVGVLVEDSFCWPVCLADFAATVRGDALGHERPGSHATCARWCRSGSAGRSDWRTGVGTALPGIGRGSGAESGHEHDAATGMVIHHEALAARCNRPLRLIRGVIARDRNEERVP